MPDNRTKKQFSRARSSAREDLQSAGYSIVVSSDGTCLIGFREDSIRVVRVCLETVTERDKKSLRMISAPAACVRETWCRKSGAKSFEKLKIKNPVKGSIRT